MTNQSEHRRPSLFGIRAAFASGFVALALVGVGVGSSAAVTRKTAVKRATTTLGLRPSPAPTTVAPRRSLVVGVSTEPQGLDPAAVTSNIALDPWSTAIYDQLMEIPFGLSPQPSLAEALTEALDRRSWTLRIRDGVRFHDGSPLSADAVKLNLERQRKSRISGQSMSLIRSIEVTGPLELRLSVDKPYASMPYLLGGTVGIMISPKAIQEKADRLNKEPTDAGTGAYILKSWAPGDRVVVVRNPAYWAAQKPRLEQITFQLIPNEVSRYAALQAGDVQSIVTGYPAIVSRARADGFTIVDPPIAGTGGSMLNNSKPPFDDVRIRRAVAIGRDRQAVATLLGDTNFALQGNGLWPKGDPWFSAGGEGLPYDRAEARRLVSSYVKDTGRDVSFTLTVFDAGGPIVDIARFVTRSWQDAGMDVKLQIVPDAIQFQQSVVSGQYQVAFPWSVALNRDPDATAYPPLFSTSPSNFSRYKSDEMDAAIEAGRTAADSRSRVAAYAEVQRLFRRDVPFLLASPGTFHYISDKKVCGLDVSGQFSAKTVGYGNC